MESVSGILNSEAERAPFLHGDAPVSPVPPGAASPAGDALPVAAEAEPAPCRPQQIQVEVAPDAMTAHVSLDPGDSGTPVALADVFDALIAAGVLHGLDDAALRQACETPGPQHFVAARATPPQKGEDASFEFLITDHRERAPKLNAQGLIDFREHGEVPVVDVGQPLIRRTPASAGAAGSDVRGQPLPAEPGYDLPFKTPFLGVGLDPKDANLLCALSKGQPVSNGMGSVLVEAVFRVKGVNMATGNVTFDGTVQVDGDVSSGMKVHASGDILVGGLVEGGELRAGGDIRIAGGAIANAVLHAGGSVSARFVEKSELHAGLAIVIDDMALHSALQAAAQISVGAKSRGRGRLAGGLAKARMFVSAPILGLASGGRTQIHVGVDPALDARHASLLKQMDEQKAEEEKMQKLVQYLTRVGDPKGLLPRAREAWQRALKAWGDSLELRKEVEQQLAAVLAARVEVTGSVDGDVELTFVRKVCRLNANSGAGVFSLKDDGTVIKTDLQAAAHGLS